jgi:hypothetical protein
MAAYVSAPFTPSSERIKLKFNTYLNIIDYKYNLYYFIIFMQLVSTNTFIHLRLKML